MRNRILRLLTVLTLIAFAFGCASQTSQQGVAIQEETAAVDGDALEISKEKNAHPVSLPALMTAEFDGRDFTLGRVLAENEAYTRHYITYKSGDLLISGIMNIPKGKGSFPVLILNHGHIDTGVYTNGRGLKREQDYLARRNYAVIHPDYRNHAESSKDERDDLAVRLGYTEDVLNAVYAVKKADIPHVDTGSIGMLGHSMGGGITQNVLVTKPDLVKAAVLFAPVSGDFRDTYERWLKRRPESVDEIISLYGTPDDAPEFWDNLSTRTFFDRITSSVLFHHGTADADVPIEWSKRGVAEMSEKAKTVVYYEYEGEPHEFTEAWPLVMRRTVEFFDEHLR